MKASYILPLALVSPTLAIIIDDSYWNTPPLRLSDGWNMIRTGRVEAVNTTVVGVLQDYGLDHFYNSSISCTSVADAWNEIDFEGSNIIIYGAQGPDAGGFSVSIDGQEKSGDHNAQAATFTPNATIFSASGLNPKVPHKLRMTNKGRTLYFDYAVVTNDTTAQSTPAAAAVQAPQASSAAAPVMSSAGGIDPAVLAKLDEPYVFHWNWRVWFVVGISAVTALVILLIVALHQRKERKDRQLENRSFFASAPVVVRKMKGFKPARKSTISNPKPWLHQREGSDMLSTNSIPLRTRSRSIDSVTGLPRAKKMTLAEALNQDRADRPHGTPSSESYRPMF